MVNFGTKYYTSTTLIQVHNNQFLEVENLRQVTTMKIVSSYIIRASGWTTRYNLRIKTPTSSALMVNRLNSRTLAKRIIMILRYLFYVTRIRFTPRRAHLDTWHIITCTVK